MSSWLYFSIGSSNGLTPNRRQAIACTDEDPVLLRLYAPSGLNGLNMVYYMNHHGKF